ncbi:MAG: acylneuraminate cytidylyltransferase family protein [Candidatus Staskawiczbacteria bacterium]|jgi:CMP-N-acetylneuraminic acid synthetase
MSRNKNIIAIIPARGGSKGIPRKNIINLGGYPLIAYSIIAAKMSKIISRVVVSTDNKEIAKIAKKYGAEVPFLRPKQFAKDSSPDIEFIQHALKWFQEKEGYRPDYLVHLRPTTPLREPELIDKGIENIIKNKEATSLRSAHALKESPHKFFEIKNGFFAGLFPDDHRPDYHNLPRQSFPTTYHPNSYVDVIKTKTVEDLGIIHGPKILPLITPFIVEIDEAEDIDYVRFDLFRKKYKIYDSLKTKYGKI